MNEARALPADLNSGDPYTEPRNGGGKEKKRPRRLTKAKVDEQA